MSMSVDGMVSGLDTSGLVRSLLQAERQPQVRLQQKKTQAQRVVDVYQQLNTRLDALRTAAEALNGALDWKAATGASSTPGVATVTVAGGATPTSLSITVSSLARAHAVASGPLTVDPATDVITTGPITVGSTVISDLGTGSLDDIASAINGSDADVSASVVQTGPGTYRLHLSARQSGADAAFDVTGSLGGLGAFAVVTQGTDATISVGDGPGAYTLTSASNSFSGLLAGATVTVHTVGETTLSIQPDREGMATAVGKLVSAFNDVASHVKGNSAFNGDTKTAGVLLGDSTTTRLLQQLHQALTDSVAGSGLQPHALGISVDRHGVASFDKDAFLAAYDNDPAAVVAAFANNAEGVADDGIAERLRTATQAATDTVSGALTSAIEGRKSLIADLDRQIQVWDDRIAVRELALRRQFSNLETMLGRLKSQSSWLAGQINTLGKFE